MLHSEHFLPEAGRKCSECNTLIQLYIVKLYQGVTLGALSTRSGQKLRGVKRHPTIEDNVTIYSGASILGGETVIGRECIIGGNCFVTSSVPPRTKVSMKEPELIFKAPKTTASAPWEI